jgi:hypothetical protein
LESPTLNLLKIHSAILGLKLMAGLARLSGAQKTPSVVAKPVAGKLRSHRFA